MQHEVDSFHNFAVTEVLHNGELIKCAAVVISPTIILLPAYCIYDVEKGIIYQGLAVQIAKQFYRAVATRVHPKYKEKKHDYKCYDIAVLRVSCLEN